ncbi:hypothetical protein CDD80_5236 [Ophiocordyceps camponoti-rufipedis]|uniref:Uncharacterized protein n=1 Tax=Ophiocordyceps camponoti-rufipedis TaxID=2004952 RepID=A0A2C5YX49_9HYPO|nr:hypothetical protein CDD80_5236 [Ophiocordyceps camponoti-rufipedis]
MKTSTASVLLFAAGATAWNCKPGLFYCGSTLRWVSGSSLLAKTAYEKTYRPLEKTEAIDLDQVLFFCKDIEHWHGDDRVVGDLHVTDICPKYGIRTCVDMGAGNSDECQHVD